MKKGDRYKIEFGHSTSDVKVKELFKKGDGQLMIKYSFDWFWFLEWMGDTWIEPVEKFKKRIIVEIE